MSRLDHDIERGLQQIADRATPSPDAWAQIRSRIADQEPTQETEIIMLMENTTLRRRWPLVATAAAAVALVVGGIVLVNRNDGDQSPADTPDPVPTVAPDPETGGDTGANDLPAEGATIAAGRYVVDTFGVPLTFDVPDTTSSPWTVQVHDDIAVTIGPEGSFVNMSRLGSLYDAEQAEDPDFTGLGSIPPDDVDGWIEANGVVVDDSREVALGGRAAKLRQVRAPEGAGQQACPPEIRPCVRFSSASADLQDTWNLASVAAYGPLPHSFWIVDLDDFEPLGIWVHTDTGDTQDWLDEVQPLIDSIVLGDPGPAVDGGTARVSTFGAEAGTLALPATGSRVTPGNYTSNAPGVTVTFTLDEGQTAPWTVQSNQEPGGIQLWSDDTGREFIAIGRVGSWYDADEARADGTTGLGSIPADDIDGWIEQNGIIVADSADVEVGGRSAKYRQIRLDATPGATGDFCPPGEQPCLWAASGSADTLEANPAPIPFSRERLHSIWLIDMDEYEPMVILAIPNLPDEQAWFDTVVQPIVDSITFGEPAPIVEGGTARVPARVTVTATMTVNQTGESNLEEPWPLERTGVLSGDITGTYVGTGMSSPNGAEVTLDWTMDATIEGIGTGTLTLRSDWAWTDPGDFAVDEIISGTGDFEGVTGSGTSRQTSDNGFGIPYDATIELTLTLPTN